MKRKVIDVVIVAEAAIAYVSFEPSIQFPLEPATTTTRVDDAFMIAVI